MTTNGQLRPTSSRSASINAGHLVDDSASTTMASSSGTVKDRSNSPASSDAPYTFIDHWPLSARGTATYAASRVPRHWCATRFAASRVQRSRHQRRHEPYDGAKPTQVAAPIRINRHQHTRLVRAKVHQPPAAERAGSARQARDHELPRDRAELGRRHECFSAGGGTNAAIAMAT
jgi:hypothetical protein